MQLPRTPHEGDLDTTKGAPSLRGLSAGHPICPKFTIHRWAIANVFMARSVFTVWFFLHVEDRFCYISLIDFSFYQSLSLTAVARWGSATNP